MQRPGSAGATRRAVKMETVRDQQKSNAVVTKLHIDDVEGSAVRRKLVKRIRQLFDLLTRQEGSVGEFVQ